MGVGRMWAELSRSSSRDLLISWPKTGAGRDLLLMLTRMRGAGTDLTCGQNQRRVLLWLGHKFCLSPVQSVNG